VRSFSAVAAILAAGAALVLVAGWWRSRNVGAVQRGFAAAERNGCFNCHGPAGLAGFDGPAAIGAVPALGGELAGRPLPELEIRRWILDGRPARAGGGAADQEGEADSLLRMPAFRGVLSAREVDEVVAYVQAIAEVEFPPEGRAREGHAAAGRLGCFQCHGPAGRGDPPNPGSLKGYIPSWSGADFAELVRDESEARAWVLDGGPRRLREHPVARFFLARQVIKMPAYRGRISEAEVEAVLAYVRWLRRDRAAGSTSRRGGGRLVH
jgi:mono/diheme cytochrome c family protein